MRPAERTEELENLGSRRRVSGLDADTLGRLSRAVGRSFTARRPHRRGAAPPPSTAPPPPPPPPSEPPLRPEDETAARRFVLGEARRCGSAPALIFEGVSFIAHYVLISP